MTLSSLIINGTLCEDRQTIVDHILDFYRSLFRDDRTSRLSLNYVEELLEQVVTPDQNSGLICGPSEIKIKQAIFYLSADSAPGPDGFGGKFFQEAWEIIKSDVCNAVFISSPQLLSLLDSILILLR